VKRGLDFMFGWFMDPLINGDYPTNMRKLAGSRLPTFSDTDKNKVKGSFDFIGLNYYTSQYVADHPSDSGTKNLSYSTDPKIKFTYERNGIPIGPQAGSDWLYIYPKGLHDLLMYTKDKYNNPLIYITENGVDEKNDVKLTIKRALVDEMRRDYHIDHLHYLTDAIADGVNVKGYFAWSFLDNFEWA
ncbi:beta-glucosidase, partial [Sarracenia purpurea var. burkii]